MPFKLTFPKNWEQLLRLNPVKKLVGQFSPVIFPNYCLGCGADMAGGKDSLCEQCWRDASPGKADNPIRDKRLKKRLFVAFSYAGIMRTVIHQMKFQGRKDLAIRLTEEALKRFGSDHELSFSAVVPVPLHPVRVRERGYDQNLIIAQVASRMMNIPLETSWIKRLYNTTPQSHLSDSERRENLIGAIICNQRNSSQLAKPVLLIDDVIHTGATACTCLNALAKAGIRHAYVLSISG